MNSFKPKDNLILTIYVTFVLLIVHRMLKNCLKICVEEHVFGKQTTEKINIKNTTTSIGVVLVSLFLTLNTLNAII